MRAKEIAEEIARERLNYDLISNVQYTDNTVQDLNMHLDRLDWEKLFED